ncbi:MAG TPA: response regulator [Bryobacteraceae bacterium]|nr:response regulator [Bryobacteraceae bacterium]
MVQKDRLTQILLIEDSPGDAWLIRDILMKGSVPKQLHVVTDGDRALHFLRREGEYAQAPRPDLVLLDINLPGRNGLDVLDEIKADPALKAITVIVLTTSDALEDVNAAYDRNANCYVVKPVDLNLFTHAIQGIEDFWLRMAMLPTRPSAQQPRRSSAKNAGRSGNGPASCLHLQRVWRGIPSRMADKNREWRRGRPRRPAPRYGFTSRLPGAQPRQA